MNTFPERRRIYLMRHGEVTYFEQGRPVPPEGVRLNADGRAQAQAAAQVLADVPIDAAISTGLPRTNETAQLVLGEHNLTIQTVTELQEIRSGHLADFAALSIKDVRRVIVEAFTRPLRPEDQFLMGETFGAFRNRVLPAFRAILADRSWTTLLLVAHGATNRVLLSELLDTDLDSLGHIEQDACCINVIDVAESGYGIVRLMNYTPYNPLKTGLSLTTMERYFLSAQGRDQRSGTAKSDH